MGRSTAEAESTMATQQRQFVKYTFFKVQPAWRALPVEERESGKRELVDLLEWFAERMMVRTYSTVGTRGDCDFLIWTAGEQLDDVQELLSRVVGTRLGPYLDIPYSYLAMTKRSVYVDNHRHEGQEGRRLRIRPTDKKYLFVYPMWKKRSWYRLPQEERQAMMEEHIRVGHEFPRVKINTAYSFGLDDQEFVVAFETDYPADFLDLVERLRGSETSSYTESETPIFTCRSMAAAETLDLVMTTDAATSPTRSGPSAAEEAVRIVASGHP